MIYVVGASSLEKAVRSIQYKSRKLYDSRITAIPGLTFNPLSCNPLKNLQNLLQKGFQAKKQNLVIRHDIINNTLSVHWKNQTPPLSPQDLVKILDNYRNRISAIIYCQRLGTPDAYKQLKTSGIPIISVKKNLVSKRQQRDSNLLIKLSLLHQPYHLELKSLSIIFKYSDKLQALTKNNHSKKNRPSQKKRRKQRNRLLD